VDGKQLMKITDASYGFGGYQDAMFGLSLTFAGGSLGVGDFWGFWATEPSEYAKWTTEEQIKFHGENVMRIAQVLKDAKVMTVEQLAGIPVEVTFEGNTLREWRVLTEVL